MTPEEIRRRDEDAARMRASMQNVFGSPSPSRPVASPTPSYPSPLSPRPQSASQPLYLQSPMSHRQQPTRTNGLIQNRQKGVHTSSVDSSQKILVWSTRVFLATLMICSAIFVLTWVAKDREQKLSQVKDSSRQPMESPRESTVVKSDTIRQKVRDSAVGDANLTSSTRTRNGRMDSEARKVSPKRPMTESVDDVPQQNNGTWQFSEEDTPVLTEFPDTKVEDWVMKGESTFSDPPTATEPNLERDLESIFTSIRYRRYDAAESALRTLSDSYQNTEHDERIANVKIWITQLQSFRKQINREVSKIRALDEFLSGTNSHILVISVDAPHIKLEIGRSVEEYDWSTYPLDFIEAIIRAKIPQTSTNQMQVAAFLLADYQSFGSKGQDWMVSLKNNRAEKIIQAYFDPQFQKAKKTQTNHPNH